MRRLPLTVGFYAKLYILQRLVYEGLLVAVLFIFPNALLNCCVQALN